MGKRIEIDPNHVEAYAKLGAPVSEIAAALGVRESTLRRRFKKELAKYRAQRRLRLRQFQWNSAEKGSVPMQIFLGKHELGQGDETAQQENRTIIRRAIKREP
jgi:predicted transcriptional regulator